MTSDSPAKFLPRRVAILGIGLLGGSVARSLAEQGIEVVGYSRSESSRDEAVQCGAVSQSFDTIEAACRGADVVVVASPVDHIAEMAIEAAKYVESNALITDVGSTKAKIAADISVSPAASMMVPAHPIAGSEQTGVENSDANLFQGKPIVLTPIDQNSPELVARAAAFWKLTGGDVVELTPEDHDEKLAMISHLPHLMASLLVNVADDGAMKLVGSGWKDLTRVASGSPDMWDAICQHNASAIVAQLDELQIRITQLRNNLQNHDNGELCRWLAEAKSRRDAVVDDVP